MVRIPNTRSSRAESRRLGILRAAAEVFRRRGFAAAGMREIAAAAELSPANLYHYFAGKDEILYFCQDRALDALLAAADAARRSGRPAAEQLRSVIRAHVLCLLDELAGSLAHLEVEGLAAARRAAIVRKRDRYERAIRRLVAAGVRTGELAPCDPGLVTRAVLGAANWTARWFRPDGARSPAAIASALADYLVRGLAPTDLRPAATRGARAGAR